MLTTFVATVNDWVNWLATNYGAPVIGLDAIALLIAHLFRKTKDGETSLSNFMVVATESIFLLLMLAPTEMSLGRMISLVLMYGVAGFVVLSTYMMKGLAERLTKWRSEKWVKELDYVYLTFGSAGIIASVNRLPFVTGKIDAGDLLAPWLLTTAVVIRFIKTRAEIGGWNKLPAPQSPPLRDLA
jgi:hypothetical protein